MGKAAEVLASSPGAGGYLADEKRRKRAEKDVKFQAELSAIQADMAEVGTNVLMDKLAFNGYQLYINVDMPGYSLHNRKMDWRDNALSDTGLPTLFKDPPHPEVLARCVIRLFCRDGLSLVKITDDAGVVLWEAQ